MSAIFISLFNPSFTLLHDTSAILQFAFKECRLSLFLFNIDHNMPKNCKHFINVAKSGKKLIKFPNLYLKVEQSGDII